MKENSAPFYLQKDNLYAVPILHYKLEMAAWVRRIFLEIRPDCVAVEIPHNWSLQALHAASRLPDISVIDIEGPEDQKTYLMCEPSDAAFEGLRSALEAGVNAYCIDLDVEHYPKFKDPYPDSYAMGRIGEKAYYEAIKKSQAKSDLTFELDTARELYMAKQLKELSIRHDKVFFIGGLSHVERVLKLTENTTFPPANSAKRDSISLKTLTETSAREVMAECGWMSSFYENWRQSNGSTSYPDRQLALLDLYKAAGKGYTEETGHPFPGYHLRNLMKFSRNYALLSGRLTPDLYQILSSARGCVDHNFAYQTWKLATEYPYLKNIDGLPELNLKVEDIWEHSKLIRFYMKEKSRKNHFFQRKSREKGKLKFHPPGAFSICSYPPEDVVIERFGDFLKKKGRQVLLEEGARVLPFSSSLEDGVDTKETIRHWYEKKLYVKTKGRPPGGVGSVVVIFDEDGEHDEKPREGAEKKRFPWMSTWLGEHAQESDMAFYATSLNENLVGPGIARCEYGGFMMSYPPRRMRDVWTDPDYEECRKKSEVLLMAAIDYAVKPIVVYVAATPPRSQIKSFASRYGRKIVYIPLSQLSPVTLNKLRIFHVLDSQSKREIAGDYIF